MSGERIINLANAFVRQSELNHLSNLTDDFVDASSTRPTEAELLRKDLEAEVRRLDPKLPHFDEEERLISNLNKKR